MVVRFPKKPPDQTLIEVARAFLERAEAGEIYGIACVADLGDNQFSYTGWGSFVRQPLTGYAAASRLAKRFVADESTGLL